jgi:hypothetical protein
MIVQMKEHLYKVLSRGFVVVHSLLFRVGG